MDPQIPGQEDDLEEEFLREASNRILNGRRSEILSRLERNKNYGPSGKLKSIKRLGWALLAAAVAAILLYNIACHFSEPRSSEAIGLMAVLEEVDGPCGLYEQGEKRGDELISLAGQEEKLLILARKRYQERNYAEALVLFQELSAINPENAEYLVCSGHALYHLEKYASAVNSLQAAIELSLETEDGDNLYAGKYLLAVVYLRTGRQEEGRRILQSIESDGGFYKTEIARLLKLS